MNALNVDMIEILATVGILLAGLLGIGLVFARLFRRASKEVAFVRTGAGGQLVVLNGGALVFPVLHETIPVNMNTLRLEVRRANDAALITRDRMRVDVTAEFYVRVQPTAESIANAAQTLGMRTMNPAALKDLVEGKFVDALRSVAAEMAMEELHEQRVSFVQKVQHAVSEDLLKNGLELEAVSLTGLDQTNRDFFNPNNAFDAEGLTKLTEAIEGRRKKRNQIELDTEVEIRRKALEAAQQRLQLDREEEYAKLQQQRELAVRRAEQASEIARQEATNRQAAEQVRIAAAQEIEQTKITADRNLAEQRLAMEEQIKRREIGKAQAVEAADILKKKAVELAEQERAIAVAEKSKAQSEAQAHADQARAIAVRAAEQVITVRETEIAERRKQVELVEARKVAEREAISVTVGAQAEKAAAIDHAEAIRIAARAEADKAQIIAETEAAAEKLRAAAAEVRYAVEAAGKRALNEAANQLTPEQVVMQVRLALIEALPAIIRESVKPMERIEGIKIYQVEGLAAGGGGAGDGVVGTGSLADQVVNSALRYRGQAPLLDALMRELGMNGGDLNGLVRMDGKVVPPVVSGADRPPGGPDDRPRH